MLSAAATRTLATFSHEFRHEAVALVLQRVAQQEGSYGPQAKAEFETLLMRRSRVVRVITNLRRSALAAGTIGVKMSESDLGATGEIGSESEHLSGEDDSEEDLPDACLAPPFGGMRRGSIQPP